MKKILLYIGSAVFAALMVYNIGAGNLIANNTDVSLESIKIMAAGAQIEEDEPGGVWQFPYQTMGWCGSSWGYICKKSYTATACYQYNCLSPY